MPELEGHSAAWHRCYMYRNATKWRVGEGSCPIRLRGYSEVVMNRIPPKMRKVIDSALKRGYRLSNKNDLKTLVNMLCKHNPVKPIALGYMGKTKFDVYLPDMDTAKDLLSEIEALAVIDEKFKATNVRIGSQKFGYTEVYLRQQIEAGGKGSSHQPQLKAQFTHVRALVDTWMESDAAVREQIAKWIANDASVLRIPFDTHEEDDNAS